MNSPDEPLSTSAVLSKRKRTTVVTPEKKIQKMNRNSFDHNANAKHEEKQNGSMLETDRSSSDEIYSNVKKDVTKLEESQHGESKVSSCSSKSLHRNVIDLTESDNESDNEIPNHAATKQEQSSVATPWESTLSQIMRLSNDEIKLLKEVQATINSSAVKKEIEMESSSVESDSEEIGNEENDTMKKESSHESLPDLIPKSDADEDDSLPDLVKLNPDADVGADTTNDYQDSHKNSASQSTSMRPVLRRSPRKKLNNEDTVEDVPNQSMQDDEDNSVQVNDKDQDEDYQCDMEIQKNLINLFKDIPLKRCKKADEEWKALFATNMNRKLVRIRQMKKELNKFYPESDFDGESISYWDIKNRYISTSSRLLPVDIVERSNQNQNQAVLDALEFLSRPVEELKNHAKNSIFFSPEKTPGALTKAVNIYRRFCGIDISITDMGMKAGDIIALMVSGKTGLGRVFFGVIEDSTLILKSPKACKEIGLPAMKLFDRLPDPRFNGIILRNVRWLRYGMTREVLQKDKDWLCECGSTWHTMPKKYDNMRILSSRDFLDSTYPICYDHINKI